MALEMLERTSEETNNPDRRITGVAVGQVLDNTDVLTMGRVQIQLPWLDMPLWARVAVLMAGPNRGTFFIPQPGDEVLVAFNHGDIREPFVIGSLWNGVDQPPATGLGDAVSKRLIRTPAGLELEFDDKKTSVTITIKQQQLSTDGGSASASDAKADDKGKETVPTIFLDSKLIKLKRAKGDKEDDEEQVIKIDKDGITIKTKKKDEKKEREVILNKDGITLKVKKGDLILKVEDEGKLQLEAERIEIKAKSDCAIKGHPIRLN